METTIEQFKQKTKGTVILPQDENYDEARKLYNAMIDKRPGIIFKCRDTDDVVLGVNFARENDLEVAIRSGGHNGPGLAFDDNGLVIDLSEMKEIKVNPQAKTVRVQAGCTWGDVD